VTRWILFKEKELQKMAAKLLVKLNVVNITKS